jgi:hypothetical protein
MIRFEGYDRRIGKIQPILDKYGFKEFEAVRDFNLSKGVDADKIVRSIQPIAFENAVWAYALGAAIALKKGCKTAAEAAEAIGEGLQAFASPVPWPTSARWAWAMAIWPRCCCGGTPSASASRPAMNPLPPRKAPLASPAPPTRPARSRCAFS